MKKFSLALFSILFVIFVAFLLPMYGECNHDVDEEEHDHFILEGIVQRSDKWPITRKHHLDWEPSCIVCGSRKKLNVHHIQSFHTHPELELYDGYGVGAERIRTTNLATLCRKHHLEPGHDADGPDGPKNPNWKDSNPNVRRDAAIMRRRLYPGVR